MSYSVSQIASFLGLKFQGDGDRMLRRVSSWENADAASLVFLEGGERREITPERFEAGCVVAPKEMVPAGITAVFSDRPKLDFARASARLHPRPSGCRARHPTAVIETCVEIDDDVEIGPFVVIGAGAKIGGGSILHSGVVIGQGCRVGRECILHPGVVLYPGVELHERVVLHAGVVVGGDGFGYVFDGRVQVKFPQVGSVIIESDVEVGCNTTIDRGSLGTTRIGTGAKVDNLVQIAHNVEIGKNVVVASQTGISGSTVIEDYAVIGGQVGFGDHARVQKGVVIGSKSGVLPGKIVRRGGVYWGVPVRPLREYKRLNVLFGRLPEMKAEIDFLKKEVLRLQSVLGKTGR